LGAFVLGLVTFGVSRLDIRGSLAHAADAVAGKDNRTWRGVWGTIACGAGLALMLDWESTVGFAAAVVGAALLAVGAIEVMTAAFPGLTEVRAQDEERPSERSQRSVRRFAVIGTSVLGVLAFVAMFASTNAALDAQDTSLACNGSVLLCDRALDDVTLAATHNSQAASGEGFLMGNQHDGITSQLEAGIRGLLIDVYFGLAVDGDVFTDRAPVTAEQRRQLVTDHGEAAVEAAEAAAVRTGEVGGERGLYLCHAFCEIGATPLVDELNDVRNFLEAHPREVIMLIIQDEGPLPADVAAAFESSGLSEFVYTGPLDGEMPTLREMIDSGGRVVVTAENQSDGLDWYHDAFELVQDTPFSYDSLESFDCEPNRGQPRSPLLLVNHWLSPVSPTSAETANGAEVLRQRIDRCIDERGQVPNVIAVDFAELGDLMSIVDELNQRVRTEVGR
jgi:hypothetical protein